MIQESSLLARGSLGRNQTPLPPLNIRTSKAHVVAKTVLVVLLSTIPVFCHSLSSTAATLTPSLNTCKSPGFDVSSIAEARPDETLRLPISLCADESVRSFLLLMTFDPGSFILSKSAQFSLDSSVMPPIQIGQHTLNTVTVVAPGEIRVIGLEPAQITGGTTLGTLTLAISDDAMPETVERVDVTGIAYLSDGETITLSPARVDIVVAPKKNGPDKSRTVFLPLIAR